MLVYLNTKDMYLIKLSIKYDMYDVVTFICILYYFNKIILHLSKKKKKQDHLK
jgi:hypothetical protein